MIKDEKTRDELIRLEGKQFQLKMFGDNREGRIACAAFMEGARWADQTQEWVAPWISIEAELPKLIGRINEDWSMTADAEPVLTLRADGDVSAHCLMTNLEGKLFWGGWNGTSSQPYDGSLITHWMPFDRMRLRKEKEL